MVWTAFSNLTNPTGPELDADLTFLFSYSAIPCGIAGTNALVLTLPSNAPTLSAYSGNIVFAGIATATNTGPVTVNAGGLGALSVFADGANGPVPLLGGEIVLGNYVSFAYDTALNTGAGGFHLQNGSLVPFNQNSLATGLTATGTNLATALQLIHATNILSSVPSSTGIKLPDILGVSPSLSSAQVWVFNRDGSNAVNVFPPVAGAEIDALGAGAAYSLAHTKAQVFTQISGGTSGLWYSFQVG